MTVIGNSTYLIARNMIFAVFLLLLPCSGMSNPEEDPEKRDEKFVDQVRALLDGFTLGAEEQLLPYASLEDWFDPYFAVKLQHRALIKSSDQVKHHFKFENDRDYSWKFRYEAKSLSTNRRKFSFLFKLKQDSDAFFYGLGNLTRKSERIGATYSSMFVGGEFRQDISDKAVLLWSPGFWEFESGLVEGGRFERASDARYFSSRFTLSDKYSLDFWTPALEHHWFTYVETGVPVGSAVSSYARFNMESVSQFALSEDARVRVGPRVEFLFTPNRELVPYFAMPEIGSKNGLRGFSKERFRNFVVAGISFELSFPFTSNVDGFFLLDVAQTAEDLGKLLGEDIHKGFGFGVRLHNTKHPFSVGFAISDDGMKLFSDVAVGSPW